MSTTTSRISINNAKEHLQTDEILSKAQSGTISAS